MPDFGNAGTRTVRTSKGAVIVDIDNQEFLSYEVKAQGAVPIFAFACKHRALLSANDLPNHPTSTYKWKWSKTDFGNDEPDKSLGDRYGVRFQFLTALKYTLLVRHHKQDGTVETIKDIDYASNDSSDWFQETFKVFIP